MESERQTPADELAVNLTSDEALVLFDLLSRWSHADSAPTPNAACFESTAECAALHALLADLEKQLTEPFELNYPDLVKIARSRLSQSWDGATLRD